MMTPRFTSIGFIRSIFNMLYRWYKSKPQREFELRRFPLFWDMRAFVLKTKFYFERFVFSAKNWGAERKIEIIVLYSIFKIVLFSFLLALVAVVLVKFIDDFWVTKVLYLPNYPLFHFAANPATSENILLTLAQISGVFLGLYFTAITVVVSTAYARVPGDVRKLLLSEKIGNKYIALIAFLGAASLLLLLGKASGYSPGILNISLVSVLGIIGIFGFLKLGYRVLDFFNPAELAPNLSADLIHWIDSATVDGYRWDDTSFPAHYQKQAERVLNTYKNLVDIIAREEASYGGSLLLLAEHALMLLEIYSERKHKIPSQSTWFERTNVHPNWLTADYTGIEMAIKTGTSLHPKQVPDVFWFESHIETILVKVLDALEQQKDTSQYVGVMNRVQHAVGALSRNFLFEEAGRLLAVIKPKVFNHARHFVPSVEKGDGEVKDRIPFAIVIADYFGLAWLNRVLSLSLNYGDGIVAEFKSKIVGLDWRNPKSIYSIKSPRKVVEQLEYLLGGLRLEISVEGKIVSEGWYRQQLAGLGYVRFLDGELKVLVEELATNFPKEAEVLIGEKRYLLAAQVVQRGFEACNKLSSHLRAASEAYAELSGLRVEADIPWVTPDWQKLQNDIDAVHTRLVVAFGQLAEPLSKIPENKTIPDYFGQIFSVLGHECFNALNNGELDLFKNIFPCFFRAGLVAHDRLKPQLAGQSVETTIVFSTEPIVDILEISGYALIYSELEGIKYWDIVVDQWDNYFARHENPAGIGNYILLSASTQLNLFGLRPRAIARTGWQMALKQRLAKAGIIDDFYGRPYFSDEAIKPHSSKIIRTLAHGWLSINDAQDLFLAVYMAKRQGIDLANLPRSAAELLKKFDREDSGAENEV